MNIELRGADRFARTLDAAGRDLAALAPADAARTLETEIAAAAPRRTGTLAGSIYTRQTRARIAVGSDLGYARPVAARTHFFGAGIGRALPGVRRAYTAAIEKALDKVKT